ncbi:peptidase inhibitor family I36 protein [Streptomyces sp. G45]|uniref:peptidase inhibitor family I36 protein n=1 Tax=Streptomyces sp. G45 TaxID=3406627 RepID=UPI003C167202
MHTTRTRLATMAAAVALALPGTAVAAATATAASTQEKTPPSAPAWSCSSGYVCFYTGLNGTGQRCQWRDASTDHRRDCSWAARTKVKSIWNRGTSGSFSGVTYYRSTGYRGPIDCVRQGDRGNLRPFYIVLSHKWTRGACS